MENEKLIAPGTITKITTMEDNVLRLQVDCQEMGSKNEMALLALRNKLGWFLFVENSKDIKQEDLNLPEIQTDKGEKTPAQQLRAVIWRIWEQGGKKGDSELHYRVSMNKIINKLKEQLD